MVGVYIDVVVVEVEGFGLWVVVYGRFVLVLGVYVVFGENYIWVRVYCCCG